MMASFDDSGEKKTGLLMLKEQKMYQIKRSEKIRDTLELCAEDGKLAVNAGVRR